MKRKPNYMHEVDGNISQLSKKRLQELKDSTVIIGGKDFIPPESLLDDKVAMGKWKEIMNLYENSNVEILTNADISLLERYCHTYSEYQKLLLVKKEISEIAASPLVEMSMAKDLNLQGRLDSKSKLLLRMDTELFLTPLSKSRAIPRKANQSKRKTKLESKGFTNL